MKLPAAVKYLLLANIAFFILTIVMGPKMDLSEYLGLFYIGTEYFKPFQLVTYMFMHANFMHIFFNMFALWMFGRIMEQVWGAKKFLIYYFVCGIGAGLVQELGQALGLIAPYACTIGASGAVFGILLAFGMTFPNEKLFIIPIPFPIKAKYFVILYAAIEVGEFLGVKDGTAHLAHLGGMLFGLILILYWRKQKSQVNPKWQHPGSQGNQGNPFTFGTRFRNWTQQPSQKGYSGSTNTANYSGPSDIEGNARRRAEADEIDKILGKIRQGGYNSLTFEEKKKLFEHSNRK